MQEKCGAKTRSGEPCKNNSMSNGRCRMHGGKSTGRPITTGKYSIKHRESLRQKLGQFFNDPDWGNLQSELALLRALLQDYLDRFTEGTRIDYKIIKGALDLVEAIGKLIERMARIINQTALTAMEVELFLKTFTSLVVKYIPDERHAEFWAELRSSIKFGGQPRTALFGGEGDDIEQDD